MIKIADAILKPAPKALTYIVMIKIAEAILKPALGYGKCFDIKLLLRVSLFYCPQILDTVRSVFLDDVLHDHMTSLVLYYTCSYD